MFGDDAVADGKAEARAFADLFGRKERLKYLRHILLRNAGAGVLDLDDHAVGSGKCAKFQPAAIRHRVDRIGCQGDHRLLDLAAVGIYAKADRVRYRSPIEILSPRFW